MTRTLLITSLFTVTGSGQAQAQQPHTEFYGELDVLHEYEDSSSRLGHIDLGAFGETIADYLDAKQSWGRQTGFNSMIEIAPIFQHHLSGGAGFHANNETNLIAQWALLDKQQPDKGNLLAWYQISSTWGGQTTSEFMNNMGILSPPNGGDTAPDKSRNLMQHFAWEQKFGPVRIQVGKLTTRVLFNLNRYTVSDREDFLTPMIVNNPVASYTARIGLGIFADYKQQDWYISGMVRDADADLSKKFIDVDSLNTGNWEYVTEFALTPDDFAGWGKGIYRVTYSQSDATQSIAETSSISLSFDQDVGDDYGLFIRYATSDDTFRAFESRTAFGVQIKQPFGFQNDRIGLAYWQGNPSDTALRTESGIDMFWKAQLARFLELSGGLQFVFNPAFRTDEDRAGVATVRLRFVL